MVRSDGNGSYIVKKVAAHIIGWAIVSIFGLLIFYITNDRAAALETIQYNTGRLNNLEKILPSIGADVETILLNQRRLAERAGVEFIEPPKPSNRYNLDRKE